LVAENWAPKSRKRIASVWRSWTQFCQTNAINPSLPPSPNDLRSWVVSLVLRGLKPGESTIKSYVSSLRSLFTAYDLPFPDTKGTIKRLLRGAERITQSVKRSAFPVRLVHLQRFTPLVQSLDDLCLYTAARVAYSLACRPGNVAVAELGDLSKVLRLKDVRLASNDPVEYKIDLGPTKVSRFRSIRSIFSTETAAALDLWLKFHPKTGDKEAFLFLLPSSGRVLSSSTLRSKIRDWLSAIDVSHSGYAGISFRAGAASDLNDRGFSFDVIKAIGCWSSDSFLRYLHPPSDGQVNPPVRLALQSL
jgi:hypothetical protein